MATCDVDFVVLAANGLVQKSADVSYPFRQDSNFWYLTGLDIADAVLVIDVKKGDEFIILPQRDKHRDLWDGKFDTARTSQQSGIADTLPYTQGWKQLKVLLSRPCTIGTILPDSPYIAVYNMHVNPGKIAFRSHLRRISGTAKVIDLRKTIGRLRQIKQPNELAAIKKAVQATVESLKELQAAIGTMKTEQDVDIFLSHQFRLHGTSGHAYDPIVASGIHAATIHYMDNNGPLLKNQLLLMDVGASYQGYAADISRTWVLGQPSARQQEVYEVVAAAHVRALKLLKPGVIIREYQNKVVASLVDDLISIGVYKQADRLKAVKDYPHLISHFLGRSNAGLGVFAQTSSFIPPKRFLC